MNTMYEYLPTKLTGSCHCWRH